MKQTEIYITLIMCTYGLLHMIYMFEIMHLKQFKHIYHSIFYFYAPTILKLQLYSYVYSVVKQFF